MKRLKTNILFLLLCLAGTNLSAQVFEAYSTVKEVVEGEYFNISYTLRNADGVDFKPPVFQNFRIASGPSRSISNSSINGVRSSEMTYTYMIEAEEVGNHTIGYATIKVGNKVLRSNTLEIRVNKRTTQSLEDIAAEEDIFVRAIPSTTEAYPGQQVLVDYKLYSAIGVDHYSVSAESDYQGFFAQPLRRFRGRTQTEEINGRTYSTLVFRRVALYPQVIDSLEIAPIRLQVGLANSEGTRSPLGSFMTPTKVIQLTSDPIKINVIPLPAGVPESFCGGVGEFDMRIGFDRQLLSTDEALTVTLKLTGNGDVKRLEAPVWMNSDSFEVYNPTTIDENVFENQGELVAQKIFQYQLLPNVAGSFEIQPIVAVFDPDSSAFVFLEGASIPVQVTQGSGKRRVEEEEQVVVSDSLSLLPPKKEVKLETASTPFINSTTFWLMSLPAPVLLFLALFIRQGRIKRANIDPAELRRKKAMKVAEQKLQQAKSYLDQGANREFFDEVSKASLGFLTDRMGIPPAQQNKSLIRESLLSKGVESNLVDRFIELQKQCELALFAGQANQEAKEEVYHEAMEILSNLAEH